jgi:metal iron transporter
MASTDPAISEVAPQHRSASDEVEKNEKNVLSHVVSPSILSEQQPRARRRWLSGVQRKLGLGGGGSSSSQVSSEVYQPRPPPSESHTWTSRIWKFFKFLGPGAVISVAYIDPDNYQTAISAGASFQYKLLFMVLVSNLVAIYFQVGNLPALSSLCLSSSPWLSWS